MSINLKRRRILQMAGALALVPILPELSRAGIPLLTGPTMGSRYSVHIHQIPSGVYLPKLKRAIEQVLESTESLMSTYRRTSELSRFNASSSLQWHTISSDTLRVVEAGIRVQKESDGAFNPASGPLVNYWGFGAKPMRIPDLENPLTEQLLDAVFGANIELDSGHMRKSHPQSALDLNAIAKGDAIDGVARVLEQFGVLDYMVEIGGEIRAFGAGPTGEGWIVGVESPRRDMLVTINLDAKAVATSGDYINYFARNGKRYSHLIDPRSGVPIGHDLTLVSVIADSAMEADAWATALMVMGLKDGYRYAQENTLAALFLQREAESNQVIMTSEFEKASFRNSGISL